MQDQDRLLAGLPKIAFAGGFVAQSRRRISPAILTAYDHPLLWPVGVAFITCTSIAALCALAMVLTGLHR
jgi:hypothetical protein